MTQQRKSTLQPTYLHSKDLKSSNLYCKRNKKINITDKDNLSHIQASLSLTIQTSFNLKKLISYPLQIIKR